MATFPRRYAIYLADLNPTVGGEIRKVRPVVVVSRNEMNQFLDTVVVCPLTSVLHPRWRGRLPIHCAGKDAEVAVDQIRTISKQRLKKQLDSLSAEESALSQAVASGDAFEHRPSECGHCVQDFLAEFDLRDLPGEAAGFESEADDTLPTAVCVYIRLRAAQAAGGFPDGNQAVLLFTLHGVILSCSPDRRGRVQPRRR